MGKQNNYTMKNPPHLGKENKTNLNTQQTSNKQKRSQPPMGKETTQIKEKPIIPGKTKTLYTTRNERKTITDGQNKTYGSS